MNKRFWKVSIAMLLLALSWSGCSRQAGQPQELVVMTHDSFDIGTEVVAAFEAKYDAKVTFLKSGDAGEVLNRAILSKENPLADVIYGIDNTFLSRALDAGIMEPYKPAALSGISKELILDPTYQLVPVDWGDVCLNYDRAWFQEKGIAPPASLEDLAGAAYKGLLVVENPATSSPGLAFLLATIGHFGPDGCLAYWRSLRDNDVWVENGWSEAYYNQFSAAGSGSHPIVVSYATSPAAEVYYSEGKYTTPPTGAVLAAGSCFRQVEFVGILKGTQQRKLARAFVEWMLGKEFQQDIPLHMWVFPANGQAELPQVFHDFAAQAESPVTLAPADIAANREAWIEAWTETVLR
jgi:thiamine transport system substrate-binding protein